VQATFFLLGRNAIANPELARREYDEAHTIACHTFDHPLLDRINSRGIVIFGTDLWASDWNPMRPEQELRLVMTRLQAEGAGIVLLHDTKSETAASCRHSLRS
jgi:peptidoglycan-N-acetylglucosamine deacetylase